MKVKECKANRKYWGELKRFNLFSVSQIWIIYEGNFTLMLTPLAVIRKLGLRHFYFITRNSLEIEIYKETECLRNYFITESIKADENEKVWANKCSFSAILSVKKKLGHCLGCIKTTCRQRFNLKLHSTHLCPILCEIS